MSSDLNPGGSSPFNVIWLGDALVRRMTAAFADFRVTSSNPKDDPVTLLPVTIYRGSIKSRERALDGSQVGPVFPMILVKTRGFVDEKGEDGANRTIVDVDFIVGVSRIGNEGEQDVLAIVGRIRTNLLSVPIIEKRARLELPLEGEIGEDDSFPQWFGLVSTRFNIPQPIEEDPQE